MPSHVQNGTVSASVVRQQVEKILQSNEFSGSEVLRNLLAFLTCCTAQSAGFAGITGAGTPRQLQLGVHFAF